MSVFSNLPISNNYDNNNVIRIIPRLDIKGPNVVKGVQFEGLRVVGRPEILAPGYYADHADEILYIDTVASLYGRNNLDNIVRRAASEVFIPLTVGGGMRSVDDMRRALQNGADKVAINTAAIKNPDLIHEGASTFGSQCIVISVQAKEIGGGKFECMTDNARERTGLDVFDWMRTAESKGAGEILLTHVDRDGTGKGYDVELARRACEQVKVPVIFSGGAGRLDHIYNLIQGAPISAISVGSMIHYASLDKSMEISFSEEGNTTFLKNELPIVAGRRKGIQPASLMQIKEYLGSVGIRCRFES